MNEKDKELLAGFHHTISEQLNSRLSESPKFFGLLIVVSTGYGYVLSKHSLSNLIFPATLLAMAVTLWASWYLAALGYAFRFLQYGQHCIEQGLEWGKYVFAPGEPPQSYKNPLDWFWLLPGIYHAHVAGLMAFFVLICFTQMPGYWRYGGSVLGVSAIILMNLYYFRKFKRRLATQN
jgi:hypothetical protein